MDVTSVVSSSACPINVNDRGSVHVNCAALALRTQRPGPKDQGGRIPSSTLVSSKKIVSILACIVIKVQGADRVSLHLHGLAMNVGAGGAPLTRSW
jgi:hypothetical protein